MVDHGGSSFGRWSTLKLSRRRFGQLFAATAGTAAISTLLAACGGDDEEEPTTTSGGTTPTTGSSGTGSGTTTTGSGTTAASPTSAGASVSASPVASTGELPAKGGTFTTVNVRIDPENADPHGSNESVSSQIDLLTYEALVKYEPGTLQVVPALAEKWEISSDGLNYTYTLRQNVTFQDGNPFNAEAVKFSIDRLVKMGKGGSFVFTGIYDRVDVVDANTAKVVLKIPSGPLLISMPKVFIVSPEYVTAHVASDDQYAEKWMRENWGGGTGPFILKSRTLGQEQIFERNPNYRDKELPRLDQVIFRNVPEKSAQRLMLEKGDIDFMFPNPDDIPSLEKVANVQVAIRDGVQALYIQVSQVVPPLDDVRVRQAVAYAFDYEQFIKGVYNGNLATQMQGPIASSIPFHDKSLPILKKDIDKAKQLLKDAGREGGGFELEYVYVQGDRPELGAGLILQEGLKQIGVDLKVVELAWPQMVERMQNQDRLMQLYGYYRFPPYPDPDAYFYGMWHTANQYKGYNGTMYGSPDIDKLMEQGRTETDPAKREAIYKQLQKQLFDDVGALFLANPKSFVALSKRVKNYQYTPTWNQTVNFENVGVS